jgi:hypothetical protein
MQVALPSGNRRNGVTQPMCAEVGAGKQLLLLLLLLLLA